MMLADAGIPTIPVKVWHEGGRWKKEPSLVKWDQATTNVETLEEWWRRWPDALPGIPLQGVGWAVIDVDADAPAFWEIWNSLGPRGPYSKARSVSGGWHFVFAQPPERVTRFKWIEGVEVLGTASLLTVYDVEEILFPRVAPRAVLPEVFWKPYVGKEEGKSADRPVRRLIKKRTLRDVVHDGGEVADLTEALRKMDAVDWRGEYEEWFALLTAAKAAGIGREEFVSWSLSDPRYAAERKPIERMWERCEPRHAGALYKALAERGIKLSAKRSSLFNEVPYPAGGMVTRNWRARIEAILRVLERDQIERTLFSVACVVAEVIAEVGKPKPAVGRQLLEGACPKLVKEIGIEEVRRTITNAFARVTNKLKEAQS